MTSREIKLLRDLDIGKIGEVVNVASKGAEYYVSQGWADYVSREKNDVVLGFRKGVFRWNKDPKEQQPVKTRPAATKSSMNRGDFKFVKKLPKPQPLPPEMMTLTKRLKEVGLSLRRFLKVDEEKKAFEKEWQNRLYTPDETSWYPRWGINGSDGLVLIDVDKDEMIDVIRQKLPPTLEAISPRRKLPHFYFKVVGGEVPNKTLHLPGEKKGSGEVRAQNHYLVAPGTVIIFNDLETGELVTGKYEILHDRTIATVPYDDFMKVITPYFGKDSTQKITYEKMREGVPQGTRHAQGIKYATLLVKALKFDAATALSELERWNQLCKPPMAVQDLERMIKNAMEYPERKEAEEKLPLDPYGYTIKKLGKNYVLFENEGSDPIYTFTRLTSITVKKDISKRTTAPIDVVEKTLAALAVATATHDLNVPEKKPVEQLPKETPVKALEVLSLQDPYEYVVSTVALLHAGDESAVKTEWTSALSAKLTKTKINSWTIGGSGKGKTHLKYSVLQALPNEFYEVFTSASPLSLFYYVKEYGEDALDGVLLFIDEVEASKFALPMLRSLTSQTEITPRHLSVHEAEILDLKIKGSRSVWFTSIKTFGSEQIKNRFIHINPDESQVQDNRVFKLQDTLHREETKVSTEQFNVCKAMARIIVEETADVGVQIPFEIKWPFKHRRFLYPIFLAFVKVVTKVHFKQREKNAKGDLVASLEDFQLARKLWSKFESSIVYRVSSSALTVLNELADSHEDALTHSEISERLPLSTRWIRTLCDELLNEGLVNARKRSKEGPGRQAWEYWKADLPTVQDIGVVGEALFPQFWKSFLLDEAEMFQKRNSEFWKSSLEKIFQRLGGNKYFTATSEIPKLQKTKKKTETDNMFATTCFLCKGVLPRDGYMTTVVDGKTVHIRCNKELKAGRRTNCKRCKHFELHDEQPFCNWLQSILASETLSQPCDNFEEANQNGYTDPRAPPA